MGSRRRYIVILMLVVQAAIWRPAVVRETGSDAARQKIDNLYHRLKAIAMDSLQPGPGDTSIAGGQWFAELLSMAEESCGPVMHIDSPVFLSDRRASITVWFEGMAFELAVGLDDEGNPANVELTNGTPDREDREQTHMGPGEDTLHMQDLDDFTILRDLFNTDSSRVRLVSILSPT